MKEKDHGLDFHLRSLDLCTHQVGHFVGEILAKVGLALESMVINERTGRRVRGLTVSEIPNSVETLRDVFRQYVEKFVT